MSVEIQAVLLSAGLALVGLLVTLYTKSMAKDGAREALEEHLPGILAVELGKHQDKNDERYVTRKEFNWLQRVLNLKPDSQAGNH